jgi:peptide/nickel transport system permease protein
MFRYILRRMFFLLVSFIAALLIIFILLRLLPGDSANALLSLDATPEQILAAQKRTGSNLPLPEQFVIWFTNIFKGDFGESYTSGLSVASEVKARLAVTIPLTLISFILALAIASVTGFISAYKAGTWYAASLAAISQITIAVPVFWIGIIFVWIFALTLHILPSGGWPSSGWKDIVSALQSLILPVAVIVVLMSATLSRYIRASVLNVINSGFLRTSRSLGFSAHESFFLHGLSNAYVPVVSIFGIELSSTMLGAVIIENVFSLPGLGSMLTRAISQHDYPSIQGVLLTTTGFVLVIGFFADVLQRILDPRLQVERRGLL